MTTGYIYKSRYERKTLHRMVVKGRQTKQMDGRKKEPEILLLYY
jgi:hypothetical protein